MSTLCVHLRRATWLSATGPIHSAATCISVIRRRRPRPEHRSSSDILFVGHGKGALSLFMAETTSSLYTN